MSFAKELLESAAEALSIAKGEIAPAAVYNPESIDVAAIRKRQKLSQMAFAERFGLSASSVKDWEQKRRTPDRATLVLLKVIDKEPDAVARAIRG